jgi:hypothetical protein
VTTPGGRTYATGSRGAARVGPGGRAVAGGSRGAVAAGPRGVAAGGARAGVAVGPRGAVAGGSRAAVGARGFVTDAGLARYSGVAVGRHVTRYTSVGAFRTQAGYVRRNFVHYNTFTPGWYRSYPYAWRPARWVGRGVWYGVTWPTVVSWVGVAAAPIIYDYGSTIVYRDNNVYVDGEPTATAAEYADQAGALAARGAEPDAGEKDEWRSLGVFALVQGREKTSNELFQLAVNRAGLIRGNYYNALTETTLPVRGAVDKKTQRVAWTIGKRERVFETGLNNLTKGESSLLVHFGKDATQQWSLVRVDPPKKTKKKA